MEYTLRNDQVIKIRETEVQVAIAIVIGMDFMDKDKKKIFAAPKPK